VSGQPLTAGARDDRSRGGKEGVANHALLAILARSQTRGSEREKADIRSGEMMMRHALICWLCL
jgi:hypothetical protein